MDYYKVLGVSRDADTETIKRAYRKLAKEFHPDVNNHNPHAKVLFQRAVDAYSVLSDEASRADYDARIPSKTTATSKTQQSPSSFKPQASSTFKAWRQSMGANSFFNYPQSYWLIILVFFGVSLIMLFIKLNLAAMSFGIMLAFAIIAAQWIDRSRQYRMAGSQLTSTELLIIYIGSVIAAIIIIVFFRYGRGRGGLGIGGRR